MLNRLLLVFKRGPHAHQLVGVTVERAASSTGDLRRNSKRKCKA